MRLGATQVALERQAHWPAVIQAATFLLLPSVALAAYMLTRRSALPQVMARWSWALAMLLVCDVALLAATGFFLRARKPILSSAAILGVLGCSYAVGGNNLAQTHTMIILVVLSRIGLALLLCMIGFAVDDRNVRTFRSGKGLLVLGSLALGWVSVDALVLGIARILRESAPSGFDFRVPVTLSSID